MKRLVLMQTPVHAAGEIKRIMRAVREDKMPLDEAGPLQGDGPRHQGGAAQVRHGLRIDGRRRARLGSQSRDGTGSVGNVNDPWQREGRP